VSLVSENFGELLVVKVAAGSGPRSGKKSAAAFEDAAALMGESI
jgi:hypothetical protein